MSLIRKSDRIAAAYTELSLLGFGCFKCSAPRSKVCSINGELALHCVFQNSNFDADAARGTLVYYDVYLSEVSDYRNKAG
jgi:hypothetical protein